MIRLFFAFAASFLTPIVVTAQTIYDDWGVPSVYDYYGNLIRYGWDDVGTCDGPDYDYYDEDAMNAIENVTIEWSVDFDSRPEMSDYVPITRISNWAFSKCHNLQSISIAGVTEIAEYAFSDYSPEWGEGETLPYLSSIDLSQVNIIGDGAFAGCSSLPYANLSSITSIGEGAFNGCTSLGGLTLPEYGLWEIKKNTFRDCKSLQYVELPRTFTSIGDSAFQRCTSLYQILPLEDGTLSSIGQYAFDGCESLQGINSFLKGVKSLGECAFRGCTALKGASVIMVDDLGKGVFQKCTSLENVDLPEGLDEVPADCFLGCSSLESITIPETVNMISYAAFAQSGLKSIELPEGLQTIGTCAFYECNNLSIVNIPKSVNRIYSSAFYKTAIKNADFPAELQVIENQAFQYCRKLENVTFREGLEKIGSLSFCGDVALTDIVIPESLTQLGAFAFSLCTGLKTVECKSTEPPVWFGSYTIQEGQNPVFDGVDVSTCTLYVPAGCKAKYMASDIWKDFNIVERGGIILPTQIDSLNENAGQDNEETLRFSPDGTRLSGLQHGLNIVRKKNGQVKKVMVK